MEYSAETPAIESATEPVAEKECPFVNRSDERCSEHLTVGGMGYAYDHCFDKFGGCPVYAQLLAEREEAVAGEIRPDFEEYSRPAATAPESPASRWNRLRSRLVEITVGRKRLKRAA